MSSESLLVVRDLRKTYGRDAVLDSVSFHLAAGSVTMLSGANGAGKSTLLRCLAGLARFDGYAAVGGHEISPGGAARRQVGYVPQSVQLPGTATVAEVLALFARLRGTGTPSGLPDGFLPPPQRRIGTLSGGQRQRVVLGTSLLGDPPLLLLDEPGANLDNDGREALWGVLEARAAEGAAVLVTNPSPQGSRMGDHQHIVLLDGRISAEAPRQPGRTRPHRRSQILHVVGQDQEVGA